MILERDVRFCGLQGFCNGNRFCNKKLREIQREVIDGEVKAYVTTCPIYRDYWLKGMTDEIPKARF